MIICTHGNIFIYYIIIYILYIYIMIWFSVLGWNVCTVPIPSDWRKSHVRKSESQPQTTTATTIKICHSNVRRIEKKILWWMFSIVTEYEETRERKTEWRWEFECKVNEHVVGRWYGRPIYPTIVISYDLFVLSDDFYIYICFWWRNRKSPLSFLSFFS